MASSDLGESRGVNSPGVEHRRRGEEDDGCGQTGAVLLSTEI